MNMTNSVKVREKVYNNIKRTGTVIVLGSGKQYAVLYLKSGKLITRHAITGRYQAEKCN